MSYPAGKYPPEQRTVFVTFQREGIHKYPAALTDPKLATGEWDDVSFLGHPHRHMFHFKVTIGVMHNDRDIEFIQFKRWCERLYVAAPGETALELDYKSCEMMAEDLADRILTQYPNRYLQIEISEDGENGATLTWNVPTNDINTVRLK